MGKLKEIVFCHFIWEYQKQSFSWNTLVLADQIVFKLQNIHPNSGTKPRAKEIWLNAKMLGKKHIGQARISWH